MTGIDLKELGKKNPKLARARAIVAAVNSGAKAMRDFRKKSGYSQAQMAAKLGVTQPRIAQLESGKPGNAPSLEQLADAAFLAGTELLVGDRSQIAGPSEDEALLEKSRSALARARELVKRVEGVSASERDAELNQQALESVKRAAEFKERVESMRKRLAAFEPSPLDGTAIMERLQTLPVPKRTLKELARSLEESANEAETTKAYDVLTRVSEAIGTTLPVVAPPPKSRRDRQKDR
jgi:transcriptional regulator with XRE-family HTH domain